MSAAGTGGRRRRPGATPRVTRDAGERLRRLLAVLAWLARHGRIGVDELAGRFGITSEELVADLELAACCGLPPYTPDQLMEIIVGDNEVEAFLGPELARPRRLTAAEGFALLASARAAAGLAGADPASALSRAAAKLEAALGEHGHLLVRLDDSPHLKAVRDALDDGAQIEIEYFSAWRDAASHRVVDPIRLVSLEGHTYLDAWCRQARGVRRFRVDRVLGVRRTGRPADPPAEAVAGSGATDDGALRAYVPGGDADVVRIRVDEEGMWVADAVPTVSVTPGSDGGAEVAVAVASRVWLERLLLQLGPHGKVVGPAAYTAVGPDAARAALAAYGGSGSGSKTVKGSDKG